MACVVFYLEDGSTLVQPLDADVLTIGRHPESLVVLNCPSVSGRHATVRRREDGWYVTDLGSSNGTRLNGAEIEEGLLKDADRIGFGDIQAIFYESDSPPVDTAAGKGDAAPPPPAPVLQSDPEPPVPAFTRVVPGGGARGPKRRVSSKDVSGYPDDTEGGCMTAIVLTALFFAALLIGLGARHYKETQRNIISDLTDAVFGKLPKIQIEKRE